jgi:hypothetical protein
LRKAKAPTAPKRRARGLELSIEAAPVLSGGEMVEVEVAELVGLVLPVERERVALETVELRPAEAEAVAEAAALEAMLEMRLESEAEADEAEAEAEAEADERTLETMLEMALETGAVSPPVRPNWAE